SQEQELEQRQRDERVPDLGGGQPGTRVDAADRPQAKQGGGAQADSEQRQDDLGGQRVAHAPGAAQGSIEARLLERGEKAEPGELPEHEATQPRKRAIEEQEDRSG